MPVTHSLIGIERRPVLRRTEFEGRGASGMLGMEARVVRHSLRHVTLNRSSDPVPAQTPSRAADWK